MTETPAPPAHLVVYVDALGTDGAIDFLLKFGGGKLFIPANPNTASSLAKTLGHSKTVALAKVRDRIPSEIPVGKRWIASVWSAEGLNNQQIARRLHVSDRTVRTWLNTSDADKSYPKFADQPDLFD